MEKIKVTVEHEDEITVRSWRVTGADPRGCMMWFDPATEVPMLRHRPPDSEESQELWMSSPLGGTIPGRKGVPGEGSAPRVTEETMYDDDLPF